VLSYLGRNNRLVMLALFTWALGEGLWLNLRQLYLAELGATPEQVGLALALESITHASLPIAAGYVSDRFGPYGVLVAAWVMGIFGPCLMALATTWQMVIPGMLAYALTAFVMPAISAYTLLNLPEDTRESPGVSERALTTIFAAYPAGLIVSPTLGGLLADHLGIRATLWAAVGVFVLSAGIILLAGHVEPDQPAPGERPASALGSQAFILAALYYMLAMITLFLGYALAPNFLEDVRGFSYSTIGLMFSFFAAGTTVINLVAGRLSPRWSFAAVLAAVWLALLGIRQVAAPAGVAAAFFAFGGIFSARTLASAGVARVVGPRSRGLAFGVMETLVWVALATASWAAGHLYDLTPAHDLPLVAGLVGIPPVLALWFVVRARQQPVAAPLEAPAPGD
jgi:predicted MFS family arabinose efflux permease